MTPRLLKFVAIGLLMLAAAGAAAALTPTRKMADGATPVDLAKMVPAEFGDWRIDRSIVPLTVSPDVQARLDKIYNQTLSRTYVNGSGARVMLSIAYGGDQSDGMRAHRPEVCYAQQGFQVSQMVESVLATAERNMPVMRLVARQGQRNEPITYWMTVGDQIVLDGLQQKLAQLRYGFNGTIPDGLLVRVSSFDRDPARAYLLQDEFSRALLSSLPPEHRSRLVGLPGGGGG